VLVNRQSWRQHRAWFWFVLTVALVSAAWYCYESRLANRWLGGGSRPGFALGSAGAAIIVFELMLWPRKWLRRWRLGSAALWMKAHIWLGLLGLPLVVLHTGFRFGSAFNTLLMSVFLAVMASGIAGLLLQQFLPRRLTELVSDELIHSQIGHCLRSIYGDSRRLVTSTVGEAVVAPAGTGAWAHDQPAEIADAKPARLVRFFEEQVGPYLLSSGSAQSPLSSSTNAAAMFRDLRATLREEDSPVVKVLEAACDQRRQCDRQQRLFFWLHSWLWIHLPLSVALVVLTSVHVWVSLRYWY